jgi:hypothetical protein
MSTNKVRLACGCEYIHVREREEVSKMCQEHEIKFIMRHAAAVLSCSHVNRDLVECSTSSGEMGK